MADETPPTPQSNPKMAWQTQIILFGSLVASTGIYGVVLFTVLGQQTEPPTPPGILLPVFAAIGVAMVIGSFLLRTKLMPPLADTAELRSFDDVQMTDAKKAALGRVATAHLIAWAMAEAVAIFGFVLAFLTHDINQFFPFVGGAAIAFGLNRPQRETMLRALQAAQ